MHLDSFGSPCRSPPTPDTQALPTTTSASIVELETLWNPATGAVDGCSSPISHNQDPHIEGQRARATAIIPPKEKDKRKVARHFCPVVNCEKSFTTRVNLEGAHLEYRHSSGCLRRALISTVQDTCARTRAKSPLPAPKAAAGASREDQIACVTLPRTALGTRTFALFAIGIIPGAMPRSSTSQVRDSHT
jgi:hypothetical protein